MNWIPSSSKTEKFTWNTFFSDKFRKEKCFKNLLVIKWKNFFARKTEYAEYFADSSAEDLRKKN